MTRTQAVHPTLTTVGALLPADLLHRVAAGTLDGMTAGDYGLPDGFGLRQAASRAWELLLPTYRSFHQRLPLLPASDPATSLTRDRWTMVLLRELGYTLTDTGGIAIEGDTLEIRYQDGHLAVHLLGWNVDLDKRAATNVRGASRTAPHSMVQEMLNRTDQHLWAVLTNGKRLRLLRDNIAMGRAAFVEFDLEGMFEGEQFADFAVLYALCHATRFRSDKPAACWIEHWRSVAIVEGTRALQDLRIGVTNALESLGTGFMVHPENRALRELLAVNHGALDDYYRSLLRVVYRLIFLMVAEDRDVLHPEDALAAARRWYGDYFSTGRLRSLALRRRAGRHSDLWATQRIVFDALGDSGEERLGLPAYGSFLFDPGSIGLLHDAQISNTRLLDSVRYLSLIVDRASGVQRPVDYKNLGAEELGSVYESLLEYVPTLTHAGEFSLSAGSDNARKATGAYYTPTGLVEVLLDETLEPLLREAAAQSNPAAALLAVTVCDPACGSGHFLVAAARRIARRLAVARTGDPEPTPAAAREAMREVVAHCIFGVDLNDLATELAKISLWIESLLPGTPLAFLDAHIKVGNALLGTTPALLRRNIPDDAFAVVGGNEKKAVASARHRNANERQVAEAQQQALFPAETIDTANRKFAAAVAASEEIAGSVDIASTRRRADAWRRADHDPSLRAARLIADAWCSAFVWHIDIEHPVPPTYETLISMQQRANLSADVRGEVARLARAHRFFHWHLEFPQIFTVPPGQEKREPYAEWSGGFSCVIGNPPYVDSEALSREDPRARRAIEAIWSSAQGNWDLFVPFVQLANVITAVGGRHAMVTPNKLLGIPYAAALQSHLLAWSPVVCHDFSATKLFADAAVSVVVLTTSKTTPGPEPALVMNVHAKGDVIETRVELSSATKRPAGFAFSGGAADDPLALCSLVIGDLAGASDGASTGQAYEIREIVYSNPDPDPRTTAKLINTGTIDPFRSWWGERVCRYLGFKDPYAAVDRGQLTKIAPRRAAQAAKAKVVIGGMGSRLEAFADDSGEYLCGKSAVLLLPEEGICPFALAAYLNAECVSAHYRAIFGAQGFGAGSMNIGPKQTGAVPAPTAAAFRRSDATPTAWTPDLAVQGIRAGLPVLSLTGRYLQGSGAGTWTEADLNAVALAVIASESTGS